MRPCAWMGNSSPCITHVSILFTILSMSDCLGICFLMTDNGVSTGTSVLEVLVYSISRGLIVLTACISKSGCFSDSLCKTVCTGVNCCGLIGKIDIFLSLIWIYSSVCEVYWHCLIL